MSKHTPGPWRIDAGYPSVNVVGANGDTVCEVYTRSGDDRDLIAAAPDLLAACEVLLDAVARGDHKDKALRTARAAIAKARGKP